MDEQNQEFPRSAGGPPPQDVSDDLCLLRIDPQYHCPCTACCCTPTVAATTCGCTPNFAATASPTVQNSAKTATPEPPSEPDPKKAFFGYDLSAFSKIPLPTAQPSPPSLRRCISDPCTPPRAATTSSSLPPKAPVLKRSVSDPTPSPGKNPSRNNDESPTTKRLRRMQDQLKVMNQWVEEIVHEVDDSMGTEGDPDPTLKGEDQGGPPQESVSVDKVGDCINIRLNCPCKKVFHVLLFGKDVFYKLV